MQTVTLPKIDSKHLVRFQERNIVSSLIYGAIAMFMIVAMFYAPFKKDSFNEHECVIVLLTMIPGFMIMCALSRAQFHGVKIDKINDTVKFHGGGISPNGFLHAISPTFIFQHLLIHTRKLSEIDFVSYDDRLSYTNSGKEKHEYGVTITGKFGAVFIKMDSMNKAKSVYSALINMTK